MRRWLPTRRRCSKGGKGFNRGTAVVIMPSRRTYSIQDAKEIKALVEKGMTASEVAKRTGFSQKVVVSAFKRDTGMTITDFRFSLLPVQKFRELLAEGRSVQEIADATDCNDHQIRRAIKRTEGFSIAGFREAHGLTTTDSPVESTSNEEAAQKTLRRRLRLPSSNRRIGRPKRTHDKTCGYCGKLFSTKKVDQQFCSHSCSVRSRPPKKSKAVRRLIRKTCECCGRDFKTKRTEQRYCGNDCRKRRISLNKTRLTDIPCAYCERLFRPAQQIKRFCSRDCAYKGKRSSSLVHGRFKLSDDHYVRFESSFELVFLLFASHHLDDYQDIRRCDFMLEYSFDGQQYRYLPDFLSVGQDGRTKLIEVKSTGTEARQPGKTQAKLSAGRLWCKNNNAEFVYLSDEVESFVQMCDFVSSHHSLDVLQHVESGDALRKIVKRCLECGKRIPRRGKGIAAYLQRKFCSATCRTKSKHGKKQRLPSSQHFCPQCGKQFVGHSKKKFCSKDCYSESQRTLKSVPCPVCGRNFQPDSSAQKTCGVECGTVFRAASRKGVTVSEYVEWTANKKPAAERNCVTCGSSFVPRSDATVMCLSCRQSAKTTWTLSSMTERLTEIRDYLGGRVPSYSEIYKSAELRERFNSCALAGAIYRFNQANGIASYQEFVRLHLGWSLVGKLTKARTEEVFERLVKTCRVMCR